MNAVSELFKSIEPDNKYNNRSYYVKALNKAIEKGVKVAILPRGRQWNNKNNGAISNLKLTYNGKTFSYNRKTNVYPWWNPDNVLLALANLVKDNKFETNIGLDVNTGLKCSKCNGTGFINSFSHICNGVCFDCLGSGYNGKEYTTI